MRRFLRSFIVEFITKLIRMFLVFSIGVEMPHGVAEKTKQYSVSKNVLYPEAIHALLSLGFQIKSDDVNSGTIKASKGLSIWSWGQTITLIVSQSGEGSHVFVQSRENHQLIGYLKDQENVNKIIDELDSRLAHMITVTHQPKSNSSIGKDNQPKR